MASKGELCPNAQCGELDRADMLARLGLLLELVREIRRELAVLKDLLEQGHVTVARIDGAGR